MNSRVQEGVPPEKSSGVSFAKALRVRREKRVRKKVLVQEATVEAAVEASPPGAVIRERWMSEEEEGEASREAAVVRSSRISR